jgi:pimeloyl-ACP methyl ester carboxylesterase
MRRSIELAVGFALTLFQLGCAHPSPKELARQTSYALARDHGRYVKVDRLELFAITRGEGRDIVLIHGDPANTYSWRKVIEPLAAHYRVHAIDLPGYGFSDKPTDASYDSAWLAGKVVGYMSAEKIEHAVLVGNSMGGHIASETAILYPTRVDALVLIAASGLPVEGEPQQDVPLAFRVATWPLIRTIIRELPARPLVADGLEKSVYDPSTVTDADVDAYYLPLRTRNGLVAFLRRSALADEPARVELVKRIRAPTLVITGDSDRLVPRAVAERYHDLIAGSRLVVFERTGHLPQEEQPERTVQEIVAFLDRGTS